MNDGKHRILLLFFPFSSPDAAAMSPSPPPKKPATKRRAYRSPLRQQQLAQTRERIIAAGSELVHNMPDWDWKNLNARAVSERAGVSERTVHRHFATERGLRAAVLQRLVEESGIDVDHLELDDYGKTVGHLFRYMQSFALQDREGLDPVLEEVDRRRINALVQSVVRATPEWSRERQENAAALLDILWQPPLYERLTQVWGFEGERAIGIITWLIDQIEEAIQADRSP